ncbi:hypothetical protein NOC27_951 [Nitrosococcus oceani AFC27]|nr:hypothetical protein NOC27_951 [Nitrosococcus oceani AFC27]
MQRTLLVQAISKLTQGAAATTDLYAQATAQYFIGVCFFVYGNRIT